MSNPTRTFRPLLAHDPETAAYVAEGLARWDAINRYPGGANSRQVNSRSSRCRCNTRSSRGNPTGQWDLVLPDFEDTPDVFGGQFNKRRLNEQEEAVLDWFFARESEQERLWTAGETLLDGPPFKVLQATKSGDFQEAWLQWDGQDFTNKNVATPWERRFGPLMSGAMRKYSKSLDWKLGHTWPMPVADEYGEIVGYVVVVEDGGLWGSERWSSKIDQYLTFDEQGTPQWRDDRADAVLRVWPDSTMDRTDERSKTTTLHQFSGGSSGGGWNWHAFLVDPHGYVAALVQYRILTKGEPALEKPLFDPIDLIGIGPKTIGSLLKGAAVSIGRVASVGGNLAIKGLLAGGRGIQILVRKGGTALNQFQWMKRAQFGRYFAKSGMPQAHFEAAQRAVDSMKDYWVLIRPTNPKSMDGIMKGFPPKGLDLKVKTSQKTGLVTATEAAEKQAAWQAGHLVVEVDGNVVRAVLREQRGGNWVITKEVKISSPNWQVEAGQVLKADEAKPFVGDYDIFDVFKPGQGNVALAAKDQQILKNWENPWTKEFAKKANAGFDRPRMLHGGQAQFGGWIEVNGQMVQKAHLSGFLDEPLLLLRPRQPAAWLPDKRTVETLYSELGRKTISGGPAPVGSPNWTPQVIQGGK